MGYLFIAYLYMSQMYKIALFSSLADQTLPNLPFSEHSYTTSGFSDHIGFSKKW